MSLSIDNLKDIIGITCNVFQRQLVCQVHWGGIFCVGLSLKFNWAQEVMEFSITLNIKTLECQCGIDLSDPQSCLTVWTDCPPLGTQTGSLARQQNSLDRPNWIGGFLLLKAQRTNLKFYYLIGKKVRHWNRKCSIGSFKSVFLTPTQSGQNEALQQTSATVTFCQTAIKREWKYSLSSHWNAQLPAVVLSTVWTWLAVSRLSQHCALHMKQDMGLYPLGEFTSSEPPPPPLPHLPPETSGPFSWRPDIPSSSGGFSGVGVVWK